MSKIYLGDKLVIDPDKKLEKVKLTQAEYDALTTKKDNILYVITDAPNPYNRFIKVEEFFNAHKNDEDIHVPTEREKGQLLSVDENDYLNWRNLDKSDVGLDKVDNTADKDKPVSTAVSNIFNIFNGDLNKVKESIKSTNDHLNYVHNSVGKPSGIATLDSNGKIPSSQLPSYVDDVLEYSNKSAFPATGETGKIYVDTTANLTYRWSGSQYVEISPSLALGETSSTAYSGDKGKKNADDIATLRTIIGNKVDKTEADSKYYTQDLASTIPSTYVRKTGDTMTGALNIGSSANTQIWLNSNGTSNTGIGLKVDGATLGWVGYDTYRGTTLYTYDGNHYLGIYPNGTPCFDGNVIWHAGNDGSGSGLDADLLDGKHAGVKNGDAAIFVNFPSHTQLVSLGYNDAEHQTDTEYYLQGICKWAIDNYPGGGCLIGAANPNSEGFVHLHLYNSKNANGYPTYCSGVWYNIEGHTYTFGTTNGTWYFGSGNWSINAASATKLKTARSLWGQSFDGTGNVSGTMSGVGSIAMNGGIEGAAYIELKSAMPYIDFHFNNDSGDYTSRIIESASGQLCINSAICANYNGNVGIGTITPTAKLDVAGLVKASSGIQIATTADIGWYSNNSRLCAGNITARGVNAGSLLVSNAWADATKVPTDGIYSKGEIISSNINAFRAISGDYGAIIRNDGEHLCFLLTNSKDQYGSYNDLRPLYINLATGLVKMQQGLQIGDCTISWDAANNMLKFDKGLYSDNGSLMSKEDKARLDFLFGYNSVTTLMDLPVNKHLVIAKVTESLTLNLSDSPSAGYEILVMIENLSKSDITITLSDIPGLVATPEITIPANEYGEVNIISGPDSTLYVRAI